jgi:uncharacterized protein (DUF342 family)
MNELKSECKELNALNYRTMIHTGNTLNSKTIETSEESLANFLNDDMDKNRKGLWSKLTKTAKINKIKKYIKDISESYNLNEDEVSQTTNLLVKTIERKKLSKNNELNYNQDSGNIESIPGLTFNQLTRTFTLIQDKPSTLKRKPKKNEL